MISPNKFPLKHMSVKYKDKQNRVISEGINYILKSHWIKFSGRTTKNKEILKLVNESEYTIKDWYCIPGNGCSIGTDCVLITKSLDLIPKEELDKIIATMVINKLSQ